MELEIRLLGQFELKYAGLTIQIPSRPAQSLLAYLVLNAGIATRREKLAGLLWPEASDPNARAYLRSALWQLRKSFESASAPWKDYLQIDEISVAFIKKSTYWLDAEHMGSREDAQDWPVERLVDTVSAYRGELLPGFFDEWIVLERERLLASYNHKMCLLLDRLVRECRWNEVLEWGERWLSLGDDAEPAFRAMLIAYAATGDHAKVKATYQRCAETLEKELGLPVPSELEELQHQLLEGNIPRELVPPTDAKNWESLLRQREIETDQKLAEAEQKRQEIQGEADRRLRQRVLIFTSALALLIVIAGLSLVAWSGAAAQAALNRSISLAGAAEKANQSGLTDLALALALEAVKTNRPPAEALLALRTVALSPGTRSVLKGHSAAARSAAFSPDQHMALSGSCAKLENQMDCSVGELILWNLDTGKIRRRWSAQAGWVNTVVFSKDGKELISGSSDSTIVAWDAGTGEIHQLLEGGSGSISAIVLAGTSQDSLLSGTAKGTLTLWDLTNGTRIRSFLEYPTPITSLAASADKSVAVSGYADGTIILWGLNQSRPLRIIPGSETPVNGIAISPDGSWVLAATPASLVKIDFGTGEVLAEQEFVDSPDKIVLSPDGSFALVSRIGALMQWDTINWHEVRRFSGQTGTITSLDISQDGTLGLAAAQDGSLRLWNLTESAYYQSSESGLKNPDALSISPDGNYLLLGDFSVNPQKPVLWDLAQSKLIKYYPGFQGHIPAGGVQVSPDGLYVAAAGGRNDQDKPVLMVWHYSSGELACKLDGYQAPVRSIAFSPDSRWLLAGSAGGTNELMLWEVKTCQLIRRFDLPKKEDVTGIAFSKDGQQAISGTEGLNRVILWDVTTGREIRRFSGPDYPNPMPVLAVAFGPGEGTILGAGLGSLVEWDIETGKITRQYPGHTWLIPAMQVSPDGKYIVFGTNDGELILWSAATHEELYRLKAHEKQVYGVAFSPDSQTIYSISTDGRLVRWPIAIPSLPELLEWIKSNRYERPLSCEERQQYRVAPLCE